MRRVLSYLNLVCATLFLAGVAFAIAPFDPKGERVHRIARYGRGPCSGQRASPSPSKAGSISRRPPIFSCRTTQSALDIPVLLARLPVPFKFVAKRELFRIPVFGRAIKKAGYINIDRENPREALKAIEEAVAGSRAGPPCSSSPRGRGAATETSSPS